MSTGVDGMTAAQGDRVIALLEEMIAEQRTLRRLLLTPPDEPPPGPCPHPLEARSDRNPRATFFRCSACGEVIDRERA